MSRFEKDERVFIAARFIEEHENRECRIKLEAGRDVYIDGIHVSNILKGTDTATQHAEDKAWEVALTIATASEGAQLMRKGQKLKREDLQQIFECGDASWIFANYTPKQVIEALDNLAESKQIQPGEYVNLDGSQERSRGLVTKVRYEDDKRMCSVMWKDGSFGKYDEKYLVKTGGGMDLNEILAQIGGQEDA